MLREAPGVAMSIHHSSWSILNRFNFIANALMLRLYCSQLMIKWRLYRKLLWYQYLVLKKWMRDIWIGIIWWVNAEKHKCIAEALELRLLTVIQINGLVKDCGISIADAMEIQQSCTKPFLFWLWGCPCGLLWSSLLLYTCVVCCGTNTYCQTSNIRGTLVVNNIVYHSDVVGASPVSAVPSTSSFST